MPLDISRFDKQEQEEQAQIPSTVALGSSLSTVRPGTVLILGPSIEQNEGSDWPLNPATAPRLSPASYLSNLGPLNWASWFNGATLRTIKNSGLSGQTSDLLLAGMQNSASVMYALGLSPAPGFIWLGHLAGDDPGVLTPAQSAANDLAAYNLMRTTYPSSVIILPTLPGVNVPAGTGNWATRATVNPQRRSLALSNPNTLLFDFEGLFGDPTTGLPAAAYTTDSIHPNPGGGMVLGKALGTLLAPYLPGKAMVNDYLNDTRVSAANGGWTIDALMRGTPGANTSATNWTFTGPAGATRALVARTDKYGNWQKMTLGGTAGTLKLQYYPLPLAFPTGAVVQVEAEVQFYGTIPATGTTDISLILAMANAGFGSIGSTSVLGNALSNQGNYQDPGSGTILTVRSAPAVVPAGFSTASSAVQFQMTGTATSGDVALGRCSLIRLA